MNWTDDQKKVIETRGSNLLISAAAGSGKTAVLTERLLSRLLDKEDPADIDEFLVVTFTRAAAAEMKERIAVKIAEALKSDPGNTHLYRQLTLVNRAMITTIDGFCSRVVRSYAPAIGLDMAFRVGNSGEIRLLEADTMKAVMEAAHEEAVRDEAFAERFYRFLESFAPAKDEKSAEELIREVFKASQSAPYPDEYLRMCRDGCRAGSFDELNEQPWMREYWESVSAKIRRGLEAVAEGEDLMSLEGAPAAFGPIMAAYRGFFETLTAVGPHYKELFEAVDGFAKPRTPGRIKAAESEELKESLKAVKAEIDGIIGYFAEEALPLAPGLMLETLQKSGEVLEMLVLMTERYSEAFDEAKRRRGVVDFSDLEHLALRILRQDRQRTAAAREIAAKYREVLIDEYQDSNYLQEEILTAVSRIEDGEDNYFCVGDVKQSIYSFRQARPDLFMEKYDTYATGSGAAGYAEIGAGGDSPGESGGTAMEGRRIDLHRNFRSRPELLDGVNAVFKRIMRREVGGIDYDDAAALMTGTLDAGLILKESEASQEREQRSSAHITEVLAVCTDEEDEEGESVLDDTGSAGRIEAEGRAIASEIRRLVATYDIDDKKEGRRPLTYRDIVVLVRAVEGVAEPLRRALIAGGVPAVTQQKSGFFNSHEVVIVLNCLSALDNPRQDIPLASVMKSVIGGFSLEDLAAIRLEAKVIRSAEKDDLAEVGEPAATDSAGRSERSVREAGCLIDDVRLMALQGSDPALKAKCGGFLRMMTNYKRQASDEPICELIEAILAETGFGDYVAALPNGRQRAANLRMLIESAITYEETSYVGLFNFVRYIENLKKQSGEVEVNSLGEGSDAVRIITIHKSKGLEYPVVFVAGMGRKINQKSAKASVLIHPRAGLASDYIDPDRRLRLPTIKRAIFKKRVITESIGEEIRVLYVALTRAKLKLYLTGALTGFEELDTKYGLAPEKDTGALPSGYLSEVTSYWDLVMPAVLDIIKEDEADGTERIVLRDILPSALTGEAADEADERESLIAQIRAYDPNQVRDAAVRQAIEERFSFEYPYEDRRGIPAKVSVSDIKMAHIEADEEDALEIFEEAEVVPLIPDFMRGDPEFGESVSVEETTDGGLMGDPMSRETVTVRSDGVESADAGEAHRRAGSPSGEKPLTGAERGTAYHNFLARLDLTAEDVGTPEGIRRQLADAVREGLLDERQAGVISAYKIARFASSEAGARMAGALRRGKLKREQPFTMRVPASEVNEAWPSDEDVLVQGIIDAYFEEDGHLIVLDYKTDKVETDEELANRYRVQLELYAEALGKATGLEVSEMWLYSFSLGRGIHL